MSATRHVTIWCDFDTCGQWFDAGEPTASATRREARGEGWAHQRGQDFCCRAHADGRKTTLEVMVEEYEGRR